MTCPVCPCPTCVAVRQQFPHPPWQPWIPPWNPQPPKVDPGFGMYQCLSCKGWYQIGTVHGCTGTPLNTAGS